MNSEAPTRSPGPDRPRIAGFDAARGLAVLGMVVVNFKYVLGLEGDSSGWLAGGTSLFDGRAAAIFVVLAGIGVSLLSKKAMESGESAAIWACRKVLMKRALFLLVLGFLDIFFWPGDILHFYAAYLAVAAVLLTSSRRALGTLALASAAAFVGMFLFLDYGAGWNFETGDYAGLWTPRGMLRHLFFNGFHPVLPWMSFFLAGMILGRLDWTSPKPRRWALLGGAAATAAAEVLSLRMMTWAGGGDEAEWCALLFGTQSMPPGPLYLISGGGTALAVISLCMFASEKWPKALALTALQDAGRLALTLYLGHVLLGLAPLQALARFRPIGLGGAMAAAMIFYAAAIAFSRLWRRRRELGPMEELMRRMTTPSHANRAARID